MHTLVIGAGFSGSYIADLARQSGSVGATRREAASLGSLMSKGIEAVAFAGSSLEPGPASVVSTDGSSHHIPGGAMDDAMHSVVARLKPAMQEQLEKTTHLIICSAPARETPFDDPVLRLFQSQNRPKELRWLGYLSTIGVYGDHAGEWVDERTPCLSTQVRSQMRIRAEQGWQALAESWQVPAAVLRLSGIYGPGRNALEDALKGRARILIKPGQVFNRIHVADLATATMKAAILEAEGIFNITDDLPAAPQDVIRYAHTLAGKQAPAPVDFERADISAMACSFYSENKRVSNELSKNRLLMNYEYPTYEQGLDALWQSLRAGGG